MDKKSAFYESFKELADPRKNIWLSHHNFHEILVIAILATIAGADSFMEMELFAKNKEEWLRKFLDLQNGIPSHDTFNRIFSLLRPAEFTTCFINWTKSIAQINENEVLAIDGKTIRGSRSKNTKALHVVSAWAVENQLVLGQLATEEKSNEITAIPKLLGMLEIKDKIVTIDAMGCQTEIADKIISCGGDYILALKGNQGTLQKDVELFFKDINTNNCNETNIKSYETVDGDHGRIETRKCFVTNNIDWLEQKGKWTSLKSIVMIESSREIDLKLSIERRFYISSLEPEPALILSSIRKHWGIENTLHWSLDVNFNEDDCKVKGDAALNLSHIRHVSLNLLKQENSSGKKLSMNLKRKKAGWDNSYLELFIMHLV